MLRGYGVKYPIVLNERLAARSKLLEDQLKIAQDEFKAVEAERVSLRAQVQEMEQQIASAKSAGETKEITERLVFTSSQLGKLTERADEISKTWFVYNTLADKTLRSDWWRYFDDEETRDAKARFPALFIKNPPFAIVREFVKQQGGSFVSTATYEQLREAFVTFAASRITIAGTLVPLEYSELEQLRVAGWIDASGSLTKAGTEVAKQLASLQK